MTDVGDKTSPRHTYRVLFKRGDIDWEEVVVPCDFVDVSPGGDVAFFRDGVLVCCFAQGWWAWFDKEKTEG